MADVFAIHHIDDVLADVLRVIADALQRAHDPHYIQRTANGAWVFHHEGDALALDGLVLLIDQAILARDAQSRFRVHTRERIEGIMDHLGDDPAEVLDLAVLVGRALHGREPRGDIADLLALIADALEVGNRLDDGHDDAQIASRRRARRQYPAALLVYGHFHVVHLVVPERDRLAEGAVALGERRDGLLQLLLDEAAHREHFAANPLQVFVEASGDVVAEIGGFHQGFLRLDGR